MSDTMGGNSQARLRGYIDRIENINSKIADLQDDRKVIYAEVKADGFEPKYVGRVVKKRKMKPHDRQEDEAKEDMYMHGAGMAQEPPLFRALAAAASDVMSRDKLLDHFKKIVPTKGEIIAKIGKQPMRIFRDKDGVPQAEPWVETGSAPTSESSSTLPPAKQKPEVPQVDDEGAKDLGREYAKDNRPVTDNPFPFGDKRRALFDEAWRAETGNDGMGKDE